MTKMLKVAEISTEYRMMKMFTRKLHNSVYVMSQEKKKKSSKNPLQKLNQMLVKDRKEKVNKADPEGMYFMLDSWVIRYIDCRDATAVVEKI